MKADSYVGSQQPNMSHSQGHVWGQTRPSARSALCLPNVGLKAASEDQTQDSRPCLKTKREPQYRIRDASGPYSEPRWGNQMKAKQKAAFRDKSVILVSALRPDWSRFARAAPRGRTVFCFIGMETWQCANLGTDMSKPIHKENVSLRLTYERALVMHKMTWF